MREYTSALQVELQRVRAGKASDYISPVESIRPGDNVLLCGRVSIKENKEHLRHQLTALAAAMAALGAKVVGTLARTACPSNPTWLGRAVAMAEPYRAKLVAETTDRFIRPTWYNPVECWDAQATTAGLEELRDVTEAIPLVTLLHPDATPKDVRAYQSWRGQQETLEGLLWFLHEGLDERKWGWKKIVNTTGLAKANVRRWARTAHFKGAINDLLERAECTKTCGE